MTMQRLKTGIERPLHDAASTRAMETRLAATLPTHALMQRAGQRIAQLAMALAPHAKTVWVACGPGNNGGDGWEAAVHLKAAGMHVVVSYAAHDSVPPQDALAAMNAAHQAGITASAPPLVLGTEDLCIDAMLGLGAQRPLMGLMADWADHMNHSPAMVLAVDMPSGLHTDSGQVLNSESAPKGIAVKADHTLMLLTAKASAYMNQGRDLCGQLWLDDLTRSPQDLALTNTQPSPAQLNPKPATALRLHDSHKGTFGDVAVVGGEGLSDRGMGMTGAALLAAQAALLGGAGRVMVHLLDDDLHTTALPLLQPAWMQRSFKALNFEQLTVVCGCGGGMAVSRVLAEVLQRSQQLVLDADALNAVARDPVLARLLKHRSAYRRPTVLTPHPLEAARLLGSSKEQVQAHRLESAEQLAAQWGCTVVLKGSGSVIAAPGQTSRINPTGNGQLATAGTGDVLAGLIGAKLAQGRSAFEAACQAVYNHGEVADLWPADQRLTAWALASRCH